MELNYIKEHTSCVNYKTEEDAGFALKEAALGEHFDNRQQEIKGNHLIFILSGEVSITKDSKEETRVRAGEFIFIPLSSHYTGTVIQPGTYISLSFFHDAISLCDKHMLSSYLDKAQHTPLCFEPLSVRVPASAGVLSPGGRQLQAPARTQRARVVHHLPHSLHKERNNPTPLPYNGNRGRFQGSRSPTQRPGAQQTRAGRIVGHERFRASPQVHARVWRNRSILASETKKQGNTIPAQLRFHLYKRGGIRVGLRLRSRFQQVLQEQFRLLAQRIKAGNQKKAAKIGTDIQRFAILDNRLVNLDN